MRRGRREPEEESYLDDDVAGKVCGKELAITDNMYHTLCEYLPVKAVNLFVGLSCLLDNFYVLFYYLIVF